MAVIHAIEVSVLASQDFSDSKKVSVVLVNPRPDLHSTALYVMGNDEQRRPHVLRRALKAANTSRDSEEMRWAGESRVGSGQAGNGCRSLNGELYSPTCRLR